MKTRRSKKTATSIRKRRSRYINVQRHGASCGPIAVANVIKWHGVETSYKAVLDFCQKINVYVPGIGVWPEGMRYVLKCLRIKFKIKRNFSLKDLDKVLESGGSFIIGYPTKYGRAHVSFVDKKFKNNYRMWNRLHTKSFKNSKSELEKLIKQAKINREYLIAYCFQPLKTSLFDVHSSQK